MANTCYEDRERRYPSRDRSSFSNLDGYYRYQRIRAEYYANCIIRYEVAELLAKILPPIQEYAEISKGHLDALTSSVQDTASTATALSASVTASLGSIADTIAAQFQSIAATLAQNLEALVNASVGSLTTLTDKLVDNMSDAAIRHSQVLIEQADLIASKIKEEQAFVATNLSGLQSSISSSLSQLVSESAAPLTAFAEAEEEQADALAKIADLLETISNQDAGGAIGGLPSNLLRLAGSLIFGDEPVRKHDTEDNVDKLMSIVLNPEIKGDQPNIMFEGSIPLSPILRTIMTFLTFPFTFMQYMGAYVTPEVEKTRQGSNARNPWQKLPLDQLSVALRRGFIGADKLIADLNAQGYTNEDVDIVQQLVEQIIPPLDLLDWWRREIIPEGEMQTRMFNQGFKVEDIEALTEASFHLPGVADIITMSVREVFNPEIARKFGQFDEYPSELTEWGRKIGVKEEVLKLFWAAHWQLPSLQMGYEMLHRRVIDENDLDALFVALDVMPYWRPFLKAISYRPLTRVDVRRIHAMGIIDREGVYDAYLDLKYSRENAEIMTQFTELYNSEVSSLGSEKARELTMSQVLNLFDDSLLERGEALSLLTETGFSPDDAELLVTSKELDAERKSRKRRIALIRAKVLSRTMDISTAAAELAGVGLSAGEMREAIDEFTFALTEGAATPSLSDLKAMRKGGIIADDIYENGLRALGFGEEWVQRYKAFHK